MKKLLLTLFILFSVANAFATHLAGGVIYYECLGGNQYKIKLIRYKDQAGNPLPASYTIRISPVNGGSNIDVTANKVAGTGNLVQIIQTNPCHSPQNSIQIEEHVYETGTITLTGNTPYDVYDVTANGLGNLVPGDCCRNNSVNNIPNPGTVGQTLYARIANPTLYPCNSSPTFNNLPPLEVCLNDTIRFDHSATDPDGDSISYYLCDALNQGSYSPPSIPPFPSVPYNAGLSGANPIPANPGLSINPVTGFLTGYPTATGIYVVNVCMDEYRNGVRIGHYGREIEMSVVQCFANTQASVQTDSATSAQGYGIILECVDSTINFQNTSLNAQEYFWDFGVAGVNTDTSTQVNPSYTYPAPGDYTVMLIANPGYWCADTSYAIARVASKPVADFTTSQPLCTKQTIAFNDNSSIASGNVVFYIWDFGQGTPPKYGKNTSKKYNTEGWYDVTHIVNSNKGCSDTITKSIRVDKTPDLNFGDPIFICIGDTAPINLVTDPDVVKWDWLPKTGIICDTCPVPLIFPSTSGGYVVTVTDSAGCKATGTVGVSVGPRPIVDAGPDTNLCFAGQVKLPASVSNLSFPPVFSWTPPTGLSDSAVLNPFAFPSQNTTYTLTVSTAAGFCMESDTVNVKANPTTLSAMAQRYAICPGDTTYLNGVTNGTQVSYSWQPASLLSNPNIANPMAVLSSSQIFTLTIYDSISTCYSVDTVGVTVNVPQGITAGPDTTICAQDVLPLFVSNGSNYQWSGPGLSCQNCPNPSVSPLSSTAYTVSGLDSNGCVNYDTVQVNVSPLPVLTSISDTFVCSGSSIQLTASGAPLLVWAPGASLSCDTCASPLASPAVSTIYTLNGFSTLGCKSSKTIRVDVSPLPNINASPVSPICEGDTVQLAASGGVSYTWLPATNIINANGPAPSVFPIQSTTYSVIGYDSKGCADTATVFVKVNSLQPGAFIQDTAICFGDTVQLFANGFVTYNWSPASTLSCTSCPMPVATPLSTTVYSVSVEDANGCQDQGSVKVTVNPLPNAVISAGKDSICENSSIQLNASGGVKYFWFPSTGLDDPVSASPIASPNVSIRYTVEVVDANGCIDTSSLFLKVLPIPNTNAGPDRQVCLNDTLVITANGADRYQWQGPGIVACASCQSVNVSPSVYTTYTVTGYLDNGCSTQDEVNVIVRPLPLDVSVSADTNICQGDTAYLQVEGDASYTFRWRPASSLTCSDCKDPKAFPLSPTVYTVTATNTFGCKYDQTVEVIVSSPATVNVTPDTGVCPGGSIMLQASGGVQFDWTPKIEIDNDQTATPLVTPTAPRLYNVFIIDNLGCEIYDSVFVDIYTPADPMASNDTTVCYGFSVQLEAHNGVTYQWQPDSTLSDPFSDRPLASPLLPVTYTVTITDIHGCKNTDEVKVTVVPLPDVNAGPDISVYEFTPVTITPTGALRYVWIPAGDIIDSSGNSVTIYAKDTTTYVVIGTDEYGCVNSDTITINIVEVPRIIAPNAFTPNGDGVNDVFYIDANKSFKLNSMKIYNRWGQLVFQTTDINDSWDGTLLGEKLPLGTYIYVIEGIDELHNKVKQGGNISLMR